MKLFVLLAVGAAVTPTQKVIQMLSDMAAKGKQEKQDEEVRMSTFQQWCGDAATDRERAIAEGNRAIEQLNADIQKAEADAAELGNQIQGLQSNIGAWQANHKATTEIRNKERKDYQDVHTDYSESIDAIQRAIVVLKRQNFDRTQQEGALVQVSKLKLVAPKERRAITAFLEKDPESPDFLGRSAPDANAYEFQSGGVIEMLQRLIDRFVDEKRQLEKEEANSRHSYQMLSQDLTDQIENATSESNNRAEVKHKRESDAAEAKGDLADTTLVHDEDQKYLRDLNAECRQKNLDFENRSKLRADELEALQQAIDILSSSSVAGHAETHLPTFLATSFLQRATRTSPQDSALLQSRVAAFLANRASATSSRLLAMLATKVAADPFEKVRKMIRDMIIRLQEEATEETEHKGWCDAELATNKVTREAKQAEVEGLTARTDALTAKIAKLSQEIADLSASVAQIDASVSEATKQRVEEKAKNEQAIADAKEAQVAVARAVSILREFYEKAGTTTSLVQKRKAGPAGDAPVTFDAPYQGMQNTSGGVVGMLEVIQSDFARLESETSSAESEAERDYKNFINDSEETKAVKNTESNHRTQQKQQKQSALNAAKKDLAGSHEELNAALSYYDKLKPSCVNAGVSYEDRVARRKEEIQSLKEALRILSGEDIA
eukprot:GEMP01029797.1.p1 GENE.GEMP01029797.1~~GEMP01029797.1.p1  ORF type:complete len:666 (+),score=251.74 GEMP01029797.1:53-2050(+)